MPTALEMAHPLLGRAVMAILDCRRGRDVVVIVGNDQQLRTASRALAQALDETHDAPVTIARDGGEGDGAFAIIKAQGAGQIRVLANMRHKALQGLILDRVYLPSTRWRPDTSRLFAPNFATRRESMLLVY
ncbi:hypothetical protein [Zhihengliuella flava]|uniref:Uncharacterized protein n=1 Tax=Zhihengliuella flava TaxID=1285193 RepID=A0A931D991_9MICC|nr:hypothetical protein [Zhihengliuella flava]MBG6083251.1 hypothetical protein [Zhihengliuella flava]